MDKRNIIVGTLAIETTRRCNMSCDGCMKNSYGLNMDANKSWIPNLLEGVVQIEELQFFGGEPIMNIDMIEEVIDYIIQKNIIVNACMIEINGKRYNENAVTYMRKLHYREISRIALGMNDIDYEMLIAIKKEAPLEEDFAEDLQPAFRFALNMNNRQDKISADVFCKWKSSGYLSWEHAHYQEPLCKFEPLEENVAPVTIPDENYGRITKSGNNVFVDCNMLVTAEGKMYKYVFCNVRGMEGRNRQDKVFTDLNNASFLQAVNNVLVNK